MNTTLLTIMHSVNSLICAPLTIHVCLSVAIILLLVNESIGMALMMASEGKKHHNKERDTVCLSLDGLRRIARLFCTLGKLFLKDLRLFESPCSLRATLEKLKAVKHFYPLLANYGALCQYLLKGS